MAWKSIVLANKLKETLDELGISYTEEKEKSYIAFNMTLKYNKEALVCFSIKEDFVIIDMGFKIDVTKEQRKQLLEFTSLLSSKSLIKACLSGSEDILMYNLQLSRSIINYINSDTIEMLRLLLENDKAVKMIVSDMDYKDVYRACKF